MKKFYLSIIFIIFNFLPNLVLANMNSLPKDWAINFQAPASPIMQLIHDLHSFIFWIILAIVILVCALIFYALIKFSKKANPVPSKTTHNLKLEIFWTIVPVIILVIIGVPSIKALYTAEDVADADMSIKVVGHQWYWSYIYPDHGNFEFDSYMIQDKDLKPGQPRLLAVDNEVVLPINTRVKILITAGDVLHSWAIPAFGVKKDAVPGRTNETWVKITKPGTYYGQCSELCGVGHGFMPIAVRAVSQEEFDIWVEEAKKKYALNNVIKIAEKY